jgi:hypothetical protein
MAGATSKSAKIMAFGVTSMHGGALEIWAASFGGRCPTQWV